QGRSDVGDCGQRIGMWCAICIAVPYVAEFVLWLGMIVVRIAGYVAEFVLWLGMIVGRIAGLLLLASEWLGMIERIAGAAALVLLIVFLVKAWTLRRQIPVGSASGG
ncbi:MAG: hypothetical protein ABIK89_12390, partial [Planctomycetota bacterium]